MGNWILREHTVGKGRRVELETGTVSQGISIGIGKTNGTLYVGGWYDGMVGIESAELRLRDLLKLFPKTTLRRATKGLL